MRGALALALAALAGCAALLAPPLLRVPLADLGAPRTLEQRLTLTRHGRSVVLDGVADVSATRVQLIATTLGVRLYALDYDGRRVRAQPTGLPDGGLPPVAALDDFLLLYAPAAALERALPEDCRLVATGDGRALYRGGRLLVSVAYDSADPANGRSRLHNAALDYDLVVDSAVVQ